MPHIPGMVKTYHEAREVWIADLPPPEGIRPVLLLMRNEATPRRYVIITPITTRMRDLRTEVPIGIEEGLRDTSVANMDVILTVRKSSLLRRIDTLNPAKMRQVETALHFALGMEH